MNPKVAVIGGGAIGLSVAWAAAKAGSDVRVVDPRPGGGASGIAAGMLAPVTELHYGEDALLRLNQESAAMFGDWIAELEEASDVATGYRTTGTIMVARDADENAALQEIWAHQETLELKAERLRGSKARRLEPGLASSVRGGVLVPDDHQVDPKALIAALLVACAQAGVKFDERRAAGVVVSGARVTGVEIEGGEIVPADRVVIAAGCWSAEIEGVPEGSLPVRPVKGQLLELRSRGTELLLQRNVRGQDVYLVPRSDGRVVVGATVEERGFDDVVTAGAVLQLLRDAFEIVPGIAELDLVDVRAGLRPGTPDNAPLLGPLEIDGLIAATGHYRNGILLAPITGRAIAELIETGRVPESIESFSPGRFGSKGSS
jgi:glycine oxidase